MDNFITKDLFLLKTVCLLPGRLHLRFFRDQSDIV